MSEKEKRYKRLIERSKGVTRNFNIPVSRAKEYQIRTLKKILNKASNTEFGKTYQFSSILDSGALY
ncbi:MAG: hypothetical protein KC517_09725, partial [Bacteroidetes bacterium]|nr:hypothetical protein [Bacteroidota bacterium]